MNEAEQFRAIKARINELMEGGPLGDGIGPGNTAKKIASEFGVFYDGHEVHAIWRQDKEWAERKPTSCRSCHYDETTGRLMAECERCAETNRRDGWTMSGKGETP